MEGKFKPNIRILYVEDDDLNRIVLKSILENFGFKNIALAKDSQEAIDILENPNDETSLIFMDIGLPVISGMELTTKIRQSNWKAKNVPIIGITGNDESIKEKCLVAGMHDMLTKPVDTNLLQKVLEKFLK